MNAEAIAEKTGLNFTTEDWKTVISGILVLTISALGMIAL